MRALKLFCLLTALLAATALHAREARTLDWMDLVPESDREAWMKVPDQLEELNRDLLDQGIDELTDEVRLPDVLYSTAVVPELEGQYVRIPGFLVPLEFNERNQPTEMFLVPYFGACIHLPPPPPNQIVHIRYPRGARGGDDIIYDAYWVTGRLTIDTTENELGVSTYTLDASRIEVYRD